MQIHIYEGKSKISFSRLIALVGKRGSGTNEAGENLVVGGEDETLNNGVVVPPYLSRVFTTKTMSSVLQLPTFATTTASTFVTGSSQTISTLIPISRSSGFSITVSTASEMRTSVSLPSVCPVPILCLWVKYLTGRDVEL